MIALFAALAIALPQTPAIQAPATQAPAGPVVPAAPDSFPHGRHAHLFTTCTTCHAGIPTGDSSRMKPTPADCEQCHDGDLQRRVTWQPRAPRATNLKFDHTTHIARAAAAGEDSLACMRCHAATDTAQFMMVGYARPTRCLSCHQHRASDHYVNASCSTCHLPLPLATRLAQADVANLPKPSSHDSTWTLRHGAPASTGGLAACATCHTREFCVSCHVNASRVPAIQSLGSDDRVAQLVRARRVRYPTPPSHAEAGFIRTHGPTARATGAVECANCHTRQSCLTCHREEERVAVVASLPVRARGGAPGVDLSGIRPPDHTPDFARHHREVAAGGDASCSRCHAPTFCASCHDAASAPGFHPRNFVQRHAQSAFNSESECAACHQTQAFCRDCHMRQGRTPVAAGAGNYHDAQPNWLFGHSLVARRSIETCATCHTQNDCLRCHSPQGWGVNPHGPGFDARTMRRKNPNLCLVCHLGGPPS